MGFMRPFICLTEIVGSRALVGSKLIYGAKVMDEVKSNYIVSRSLISSKLN